MMLCDDCKQQPAVVHLTQIINGQKTEVHLCLVCASRRSIQIWPIPQVPQVGMSPPAIPGVGTSSQPERTCEKCGYTWREFVSSGFLGCVDCYKHFEDLLTQIVAKNYGNVRHQGKFPAHRGGSIRIRREIASLRSRLETAIQEEKFEEAARLRDEIRALEQEVG